MGGWASHLNPSEIEDPQTIIEHLHDLPYEDKLAVLEKCWGDHQDTALTKTVKLINSDPYKRMRNKGKNLVEQILDYIRLEHRFSVVTACDDCDRKTPLHLACLFDDTETVQVLIKSVTDQQQRISLLSVPETKAGFTVLYYAARFSSVETIMFILKCVPPENLLCILESRDPLRRTLLDAAVENTKHEGACVEIIRFMLSTYDASSAVLEDLLSREDFLYSVFKLRSATFIRDLFSTLPVNISTRLLLPSKQSAGTVLHVVSHIYKMEKILELLRYIKDSLSTTVMERLLLSRDQCGCTFLHYAVVYRTAEQMKGLLSELPADGSITSKLLLVPTTISTASNFLRGHTVLHETVRRAKHEEVVLELLRYLNHSLISTADAKKILFALNADGQTFLHTAARSELSAAVMESLLAEIPIQMALKLIEVKDRNRKTAAALASPGLKQDLLNKYYQAARFYHLETPPQVLVFYTTKGRLSEETVDGHKPDAEAEKDCIERFFIEKNIPCEVFKDPTAQQILSGITAAQTDSSLSALVVFIMSHGEKGVIFVEGCPNFITLQEVISHMNRGAANGKPKALLVQACQSVDNSSIQDRSFNQFQQDAAATGQELRDPSDALPTSLSGDQLDVRLGPSSRQNAMKEGVTLKHHHDFLLYLATVTGGSAIRNLMIPCLMESLEELGEEGCLSTACLETNNKIKSELMTRYPGNPMKQLPKCEFTLSKRFCIARRF